MTAYVTVYVTAYVTLLCDYVTLLCNYVTNLYRWPTVSIIKEHQVRSTEAVTHLTNTMLNISPTKLTNVSYRGGGSWAVLKLVF